MVTKAAAMPAIASHSQLMAWRNFIAFPPLFSNIAQPPPKGLGTGLGFGSA